MTEEFIAIGEEEPEKEDGEDKNGVDLHVEGKSCGKCGEDE